MATTAPCSWVQPVVRQSMYSQLAPIRTIAIYICICIYAYVLDQLHRSTQEILRSHKFQQHQQLHPLALFGWLGWKPVTGKYTYIYINIYTHSLDSPVPGLSHPVYPLTSPGCPDLPAASPTGRHPHARRGLSGSWSKEWHRSTLRGVLQGFVEEALCPRMLAACCSSELMVWARLFPSSWD